MGVGSDQRDREGQADQRVIAVANYWDLGMSGGIETEKNLLD